jgi:hypothetical protein
MLGRYHSNICPPHLYGKMLLVTGAPTRAIGMVLAHRGEGAQGFVWSCRTIKMPLPRQLSTRRRAWLRRGCCRSPMA